jgi:hypothetical protein
VAENNDMHENYEDVAEEWRNLMMVNNGFSNDRKKTIFGLVF